MMVSELDILSLTDEGIQLKRYGKWIPYMHVRVIHSSSMTDYLLMIEMLTLLINSFDGIVNIYESDKGVKNSGYVC